MGKYFTISELVASQEADHRAINNRLPRELVPHAQQLIDRVLDPLREAYGKPIRVTSGYRCPELNRVVGGSPTSDHMQARAADIVGTPNTREENRLLFELAKKLDFDQLIDERNLSWIHISYRSAEENRHQILRL